LAEVPISGPITNLQDAQAALRAGLINALEAANLVRTYLDANEDLYGDGDLAEIVCLNLNKDDITTRVPDLLEKYLKRAHPEFDPLRPPSEQVGRAYLKELLQAFLRGERSHSDVQGYVYVIEQAYDDATWLGDLYNACDWWLPEHEAWGLPALRKEAQRLIVAL
jgi:hypothetical protein